MLGTGGGQIGIRLAGTDGFVAGIDRQHQRRGTLGYQAGEHLAADAAVAVGRADHRNHLRAEQIGKIVRHGGFLLLVQKQPENGGGSLKNLSGCLGLVCAAPNASVTRLARTPCRQPESGDAVKRLQRLSGCLRASRQTLLLR